jgi:hypothetical protein
MSPKDKAFEEGLRAMGYPSMEETLHRLTKDAPNSREAARQLERLKDTPEYRMWLMACAELEAKKTFH